MSSSSGEALRRILTAGQTLFGRHGFQRTSMADIAREAGIARATLYLRYSDKRALFEALAAMLVDDALAGAEAAWNYDGDLAANLEAVVLAKELGFFRLINATPHGAELLAVDAELTSRHVARLDAGYTSMLARFAELARAGGGGSDGVRRYEWSGPVCGDRRCGPQARSADRSRIPRGGSTARARRRGGGATNFKGETSMIIVEGWVRMTSAAEIDRLRDAAVEMMRATKAAEPGCLEYAYALDLAEPELLRVIERWTDDAALTAHFATPHMTTFQSGARRGEDRGGLCQGLRWRRGADAGLGLSRCGSLALLRLGLPSLGPLVAGARRPDFRMRIRERTKTAGVGKWNQPSTRHPRALSNVFMRKSGTAPMKSSRTKFCTPISGFALRSGLKR